jgi:Tol biopolymer transport system component
MLAMTGIDSRLRSSITLLSVKTGVTRDIALGFRPHWSPDGRSLVYEFATGRQEELKIRIVRAAGGQPRTVARGFRPTWSPDGRRIAFLRYPPQTDEATLWLAPSRGGRPHVLAHAVADSSLSWSPGGRWLAFTRHGLHSRPCDPIACAGLYVVPTSGGRPRRLAVERRLITPLAWSRDGRRLLYAGAILPDG